MGKQYRTLSPVIVKSPASKEGLAGREVRYDANVTFESDADLSDMLANGWIVEAEEAGGQDVLKETPGTEPGDKGPAASKSVPGEVKPLGTQTGGAPLKK